MESKTRISALKKLSAVGMGVSDTVHGTLALIDEFNRRGKYITHIIFLFELLLKFWVVDVTNPH